MFDVLPHRFPFLLVDRPTATGACWRLSSGASLLRSTETLSPILLLELLAQTALVCLPRWGGSLDGGGGEVRGYLVGIDRANLPTPGVRLVPGDDFLATLEPAGAFGRLIRVDGKVLRGGEPLVEARLSLALEKA